MKVKPETETVMINIDCLKISVATYRGDRLYSDHYFDPESLCNILRLNARKEMIRIAQNPVYRDCMRMAETDRGEQKLLLPLELIHGWLIFVDAEGHDWSSPVNVIKFKLHTELALGHDLISCGTPDIIEGEELQSDYLVLNESLESLYMAVT